MAWSARKAAAALAVFVMAAGIVLALLPLSIERKDRFGETIACGTAVEPDPIEARATEMALDFANQLTGTVTFGPELDFSAQCESRVHLQQAISYPTAGTGVLVLAFIGLTTKRRPKAAVQTGETDVDASDAGPASQHSTADV